MKIYQVENLTHHVGVKLLFDQIQFIIEGAQKIGLVGINGSGKSTFLDILAGKTDADQVKITKPSDYYIGYLEQEGTYDEESSVLDTVFQGDTPIMKAVHHYEQALQELSLAPENSTLQGKFSRAEEEMNKQNGWTAAAEAKTILAKLGITEFQAKMGELSGGQIKRVMLAQVLIQAPDLLILDEPTNHLDYDMIRWLEDYIANYPHAVLLVSHDRYFLNNAVDKIIELRHQQLYSYPGNYEKYVALKSEEEAQRNEAAHKNKQLYKQELAWMREGVRARGTKQKARVDRFQQLEEQTKNSSPNKQVEMNFSHQRLGKQVIELEEACLSFDDLKILDHFDLLVQNRARIGITGGNGSGKSSLLNVITGKIALDAGSLKIGETVKFGYYTQKGIQLDENKRILSYLQETAHSIPQADGSHLSVSQLLENFLFPRSTHGSLISSLSGGERKRLYLLHILMQQPNVLLLDEPTNDLDIETLTILEDYLKDFAGAVLTISHDRYFLDKVCDHLLVFHGQANIEKYTGQMSDYLADFQQRQASSEKAKRQAVKTQAKNQQAEKKEKTKLNYHEQKEWESIEEELFAMDDRLREIDEEMMASGHDLGKLQDLDQEKKALQKELDEKMERWEYLSQFVK